MGKRKNEPTTETLASSRNEKRVRRYVVIALCIAFFVAVNMVIIFALSAESREESGARSADIASLMIRIFYSDYENMSYDDQQAAMESVHHYVRKAAHFLEYALLGFLTSALLLFLRRYLYGRRLGYKITWLYPTIFCILYAVTDEVHQIFSNRGASPKDVVIDSVGAIFGILCIQLIAAAVRRKEKGKCRKRKHQGGTNGNEATRILPGQEEPPCSPPDTV